MRKLNLYLLRVLLIVVATQSNTYCLAQTSDITYQSQSDPDYQFVNQQVQVTNNIDHAVAYGDEAVVSAEIELEFELDKRIALAIKLPDGSFTDNTLFDGVVLQNNSLFTEELPLMPMLGNDNLSGESLSIYGSIYSNTDAILDINVTNFTYENNSSLEFKPHISLTLKGRDFNNSSVFKYLNASNNSNDSFNINESLDFNLFSSEDSKLTFLLGVRAYIDTIHSYHKAGRYFSMATITATVL